MTEVLNFYFQADKYRKLKIHFNRFFKWGISYIIFLSRTTKKIKFNHTNK